jgi:hypothetical protein
MEHIRQLAVPLALTLCGCQVTNGVLCSYLNDNCGDEAGEETGEPEAPPPPQSACALIGDATGLDLVDVHPLPVSAGVWMGLAAASLVFEPDIVGFTWGWLPGGQPGDTATLDSLEQTLTVYTPTPNDGVAILGYAYTEPVGGSANLVRPANGFSGDSSLEITATALPLGAESTLWYAPLPIDGLAVPSRWDFTGGLRARGVVTSGGSTLAGPAGGNVKITEEGMPSRGFLPTMGWCAAAPPVADDTGAPGTGGGDSGAPEPEPPLTCAYVAQALELPEGSLGWLEVIPGVFLEGPDLLTDARAGLMVWNGGADGWTWALPNLNDPADLVFGQDFGIQEGCSADADYPAANYIQLDDLDGEVFYRANVYSWGAPVENGFGIPLDYTIPASLLTLPDGSTLAAVLVDDCLPDGRWEIAGTASVVGIHKQPTGGLSPWRRAGPLDPLDVRDTIDEDGSAFAPIMGACIRPDDYGPPTGSEPLDESGG